MKDEARSAPAANPAGQPDIMVVDDEAGICVTLHMFLEMKNFQVRTAPSARECLESLRVRPADVVVSDIKMEGRSGLDLLGAVKREWPQTEVVLLTGFGTMEHALEAIRLGAFDFLLKPVEDLEHQFFRVIVKAVERHRLVVENSRLAQELQEVNENLRASNRELKRSLALFESLYRTTQAISRLTRKDDVLDLALDTLVHGFGVEMAAILLAEKDGETYRSVRAHGLADGTKKGLCVKKGEGKVAEAILSGRAAVIPGLVEDTGFLAGFAATDRGRIGSAGSVPVVAGRRVLGSFLILRAKGAPPIQSEDLQQITILAGQLGPALAVLEG